MKIMQVNQFFNTINNILILKIMLVNQCFITINNILNVDSCNSSIFSFSSSPAFSVSVTVVLRSCKHRGAPISKQCLLKEHYCTIVGTRCEALVHIEGPGLNWLALTQTLSLSPM